MAPGSPHGTRISCADTICQGMLNKHLHNCPFLQLVNCVLQSYCWITLHLSSIIVHCVIFQLSVHCVIFQILVHYVIFQIFVHCVIICTLHHFLDICTLCHFQILVHCVIFQIFVHCVICHCFLNGRMQIPEKTFHTRQCAGKAPAVESRTLAC